MANRQTFIGRGISNILRVLGCLVILIFLVGAIGSYVENFIPYNIVPRSKLDNPNKFNTDYVYDELQCYSDYRGVLKSKTLEAYEKTGIQLYYLWIDIPESITTKNDAMSYIRGVIKDKFDDPYGFYFINAYHANYRPDGYVSFYDEYIYGDEVSDFMDSKALAIYNAAYRKYYSGSFGRYYNSQECAARALAVTGNRLVHPFLCLFGAGIKLGLVIVCIIFVIFLIQKVNRKYRNKEILDTPMKDLVAEHAEDIRDKYE